MTPEAGRLTHAVNLTPEIRLPLLVAFGVFGALAFPTTGWSFAAWVWLAPALACALTRTPRQALGDGWLTGTVFFLVLLRWLEHTLRSYSQIPWPLTWLPILALAAYCGLYAAGVTAAVAWLREGWGSGWALAAAPVLWVGGELIRGRLLGGFPWGFLGYSQHAQLPIIQIAELTGVYGVSFLVVAINAALVAVLDLGWRARAGGAAAVMLLSGSVSFGLLVLETEASRSASASHVRVAVVQPAIEQSLKWTAAHRLDSLAVLERLTRDAARSRPAVILWPETAVPVLLREDAAVLARLTSLAGELSTPLLVGSVDQTDAASPQLLNSAFFITSQGISAKYDKIHLVPFGEYVPLADIFGFIRGWATFVSDFAAGQIRTAFSLPGVSFASVIWYEVIFPELFRKFVADGAGFMVNITNDAWFGTTSGPWQHLGMLPLRAVENRTAIARAANTGVSALVEPTGRIVRMLPMEATGFLEGQLPLRHRTTVYTRVGDWFAYACLAVSGGLLGVRAAARAPWGLTRP